MSGSQQSPSVLQLSRGSNGLGFNIRGGVDQPHLPNDKGIFVTKIRDSGSAAQDGRLQEGDKILEINGKSLLEVTHNDAVDMFINAGEEVTIKVWHGAERFLVNEYTESMKPGGMSMITTAALVGLGVVIVAGLYYVFVVRE